MTKKIFYNFDTQKAEKSPAYMIEWKAERAQTDRIIQFIQRILKLNNICRGTITKRAGMGNGQIGRILKCDADKVLHPNMAKRLAITTITLIPDLNKHEALRHETTNNTWPYAVCRIDDTDLREKLRAEFIAAFGNFGYYLVEELEDMDEAMKACNDFYQSYTKLNNK